eukprot:TRINITY_DN818_c1_g3_i1.p1 TRINITY_DN818_c1_g3~~TRINITY_DN818_c1_g3_i1.p1  ORF type:complete len:906 (+),score=119.49 TRINITY_DN818_c1_g3_i1:3201-5918(+)
MVMGYPGCDSKILSNLLKLGGKSAASLRRGFNEIPKTQRAIQYYPLMLNGLREDFSYTREIFREIPPPSSPRWGHLYVPVCSQFLGNCCYHSRWEDCFDVVQQLVQNQSTRRYAIENKEIMMYGLRAARALKRFKHGIDLFSLIKKEYRTSDHYAIAIELNVSLRKMLDADKQWIDAQLQGSLQFTKSLYSAALLIPNRTETVSPPTNREAFIKIREVAHDFKEVYKVLDTLNRPSPKYFLPPLYHCRDTADYKTALRIFRRIPVPASIKAGYLIHSQDAYRRAISLLFTTYNNAGRYLCVIKLSKSLMKGEQTRHHFDRSPCAQTDVLKAYSGLRDVEGGIQFFRSITTKVEAHYSLAMKLCLDNEHLSLGLDISNEASEKNFSSPSLRQAQYRLQQRLGEASHFSTLSNRNNLFEWNTAMGTLIAKGNKTRSSFLPTGFDVLDMMDAVGVSTNVVSIATAILTLSKTFLSTQQKNRIVELVKEYPNTETFGAALVVLGENSDTKLVLELFHLMDATGIERTAKIYTKMLEISTALNFDFDLDYTLIPVDVDNPRLLWLLIKRHLQCDNFDLAISILRATPVDNQTAYMFTAILEGCCGKEEYNVALELFWKSSPNVREDIVVRTVAASASLKFNKPEIAKKLLQNTKTPLDTSAMRTLVATCARLNDFQPITTLLCNEQHIAYVKRVLLSFYVHQVPEQGVIAFDKMSAAGIELTDSCKDGVLQCLLHVSEPTSRKSLEILRSMNVTGDVSSLSVLDCCKKDKDVDTASELLEELVETNQLTYSHVISLLQLSADLRDPDWGLHVLEYVRPVSYPSAEKPVSYFFDLFRDRTDLTSKLYSETPPHLLDDSIHYLASSFDINALSNMKSIPSSIMSERKIMPSRLARKIPKKGREEENHTLRTL